MALPIKFHTVTAYPPAERQRADGALLPHGRGTGRQVSCQVSPERSTVMFERFGVELLNPFLLLCDSEDAGAFETGGEVDWNGHTYAIRAVQRFEGIGLADHCSVMLERLEVAPEHA